jgi:hypothetical protein
MELKQECFWGKVKVYTFKDSFIKLLLVATALLFFSSTLYADTLKEALENAYNNSDELLIQRMAIRESAEVVA